MLPASRKVRDVVRLLSLDASLPFYSKVPNLPDFVLLHLAVRKNDVRRLAGRCLYGAMTS